MNLNGWGPGDQGRPHVARLESRIGYRFGLRRVLPRKFWRPSTLIPTAAPPTRRKWVVPMRSPHKYGGLDEFKTRQGAVRYGEGVPLWHTGSRSANRSRPPIWASSSEPSARLRWTCGTRTTSGIDTTIDGRISAATSFYPWHHRS